MPILTFIFWCAAIGFVTWLVITYIPMPEPIKRVIVIGVVVALVVWILQLTGILSIGGGPTIPRLR